MPWWAWIVVAGAVVAVLTRRWNPTSRASAASELGRRWAVLVHFWPVWRVAIAIGVAGLAILLATLPATHEATTPARAAKPSPTQAAPSPSPSHAPSPSASPTTAAPLATHGGEGQFPNAIFLVILIALALTVGLVWPLARRHVQERRVAAYLGDDLDDPHETDDADGWPPGSGPGRTNTDTEDDDDDTDGYEYDPGPGGGGVVGAGPVRGVSHRGRRRARRPGIQGR